MRRERILIFRPDHIGDVVLFSGALKQIRLLYPDAHLTLAVQPHIVNLVELCPYVNSCVPVNLLTWVLRIKAAGIPYAQLFEANLREVNRYWNRIFSKFDMIVYPVKSPQVCHLDIVHELNAKKAIGIIGCNVNVPQNGYPKVLQPVKLFTDRFDVSNYDPWRHELLTTFDFLRYLGCQISSLDDIQPEFWLSDCEVDHLAEARKFGKKIVGLFPGGSFKEKCWTPENFGEVARFIGQGHIYTIFGSKTEELLADDVASCITRSVKKSDIVNLVGRTSLRELVKSIASCDIFIGMDTSGLHVAIASGVPTIGIIGGGHYGRFVPWGRNETNIFLTRELDCFYCNWLCTKNRVECVQGVTPREVADEAKRLLDLNS